MSILNGCQGIVRGHEGRIFIQDSYEVIISVCAALQDEHVKNRRAIIRQNNSFPYLHPIQRIFMALSKIESSETYGETTFRKVDAKGKSITETVFSDCSFVRCDFSETSLHTCRFIKCRFDDCSMKMTSLKDSTFSMVTFAQCHLMGVDWSLGNWADLSAKVSPIQFEGCMLQYGIFFGLKLKKISFKGCDAREVNFAETDLSGADFTGTDLAGATFLRTDLTDANFAEAKNYTLSLKDNTTKGTKFSLPEAMRLLYALDIVIVNPDA